MKSNKTAKEESTYLILSQVRESFGRVVYSHKVHEKQADICFSKHRWQQGVLIGLTAIGSVTFLTEVVGLLANRTAASLTTSLVALLVTWASLGAKTFNYFEEAEAHRATASQLWTVRESYISLITDLMSGDISGVDAQVRRDELQEKVYAIYSVAPRTSGRAFKRAQDGLKNNEEMTFDPREIDLFLPEALRFNDDKD
ncbi:SLATT domain-containing protein [Arachnia propionica]|jgi:hypothetical protein|uniref:SLATT domain-containing protein n=1 Tax=Arachnia propionica TaxID=1750 RepID=A0AB37I3T6_9ACTN|nr:SLATT domain-containing protein [Arachnia propionica]QCT38713.1 SLATT domain-containing protein [Arachnia propionica]QUC11681.1 SLATT domain-containing protein [Arachnia propionica]RPA18509.1 SLATT domain-containing protein [Arachnia propionica]